MYVYADNATCKKYFKYKFFQMNLEVKLRMSFEVKNRVLFYSYYYLQHKNVYNLNHCKIDKNELCFKYKFCK